MSRFRDPRARIGLELLEGRRVPSATARLSGGVLRILGTDAADQIVVQSSWVAPNRPRGAERIQVSGVGSFRAGLVRKIVVDAGAGDDFVQLNLRRWGSAPQVLGGEGNDTLIGRIGADAIWGGGGNDVIQGRGGADRIDPGVGNNWVNGKQVLVGTPPVVVPPAPTTPTPAPTKPGWVLIPQKPQAGIDIAAWVKRIGELTNQERLKAGLNALSIDATLVRLAELQANQMAKHAKMQHVIPEAAYPDMQSRADAVGYKLRWLGENLAYNYGDPEAVVQGWMMSTGHRDNMLFGEFTEMGIGITLDAFGRPYVALELGLPK